MPDPTAVATSSIQSQVAYSVHRPVYSLSRFDENYLEDPTVRSPNVQQIRSKCQQMCTPDNILHSVLSFVPFFSILKSFYRRQFLLNDLVAGVTMAVFHIPQGMAYGLLAGLQPINGLYTSFFPVVVYFFLGTSRHLSLGTFALMSLMMRDPVERVTRLYFKAICLNSTDVHGFSNITCDINEQNDNFRLQVAISITLLVGIIQFSMGVVRLGFLVTYLSDALISGFTTAAAFHVLTSQLSAIFGFRIPPTSGPGSFVLIYIEFFKNIEQIHWVTVLISVICIALLTIYRELIDEKFRKKFHAPIPVELLLVLLGTLFSYLFDFKGRFNVNIVGPLPAGLKAPVVPQFRHMNEVIGDIVAMAIVGFAMSASLGKMFAMKFHYQIDYNQELLAIGGANIFGSFFRCHLASGALSRTSVVVNVGMKSQISSAISCGILLMVLLFIGPLFQTVPNCILSSIIVVSLKGMLMQFTHLKTLGQVSFFDMGIWIVSFLATIFLDVTYGLCVGFVFALMTIIFRTQVPKSRILGRIPGTDIYKDNLIFKQAVQVPHVKIFRFDGPLYFANAETFRESLYTMSGVNPRELFMERRKTERKSKKMGVTIKTDGMHVISTGPTNSNIEVIVQQMYPDEPSKRPPSSISVMPKPPEKGGAVASDRRPSVMSNESEDIQRQLFGANGPLEVTFESSQMEDFDREIHHIIIDCSTWAFIDSVGVRILQEVISAYRQVNVTVFLAVCKASVRSMFVRSGVYTDIGKDFLYLTVHDAVLASLSDNLEIQMQSTSLAPAIAMDTIALRGQSFGEENVA